MKWVYFKSDKFKAEPDEAELINPVKCGRQLAKWLGEKLTLRGYEVGVMYAEDWGFEFDCILPGKDKALIGCQNDGTVANEWACTLRIPRGFLHGLFRRGKADPALDHFQGALSDILSKESQISEVRWE